MGKIWARVEPDWYRCATVMRRWVLLAMMGIALGGCSSEQRAVLRLTAIGFQEQATVAIDAVRNIYQLRNPTRSPAESRSLLVNRLLESNLDFRDVRRVDAVITGDRQTSSPGSSNLELAFDDLTAQYQAAAAMFSNIEQTGLFGGEAIAGSARPARSLTVKMLLLAKQIHQNPPTPLDPNRVILSRRLRDLRNQFDDPNLSAAARQTVRNQVSQQVDEWLRVDEEERRLLCDATAKLLRAAETGQQLSRLIEDYPRLNFDQVMTRITSTFSTASSLTGRDYSGLTSRLQSLDATLKQEAEIFAPILAELNQRYWQSAVQQPISEPSSLICPP